MAVPVVDPNNFVPVFDLDREGVSQVTLADGTVKYFQGNYAEQGEIDRIEIVNPGQYKPGVTPTVQLIDDNGDNISHSGAVFRVTVSSKGHVLSIVCPRDAEGSGFTGPVVKAKLVAPAADTIVAGEIVVSVKSGQFLDITQSEADKINENAQAGFNAFNARTRPGIQQQLASTTDEKGQLVGMQPPSK
tara:strand:- start:186 stop:752 length:567 start_codon:yes stop_codon:yes gene_type:complete